jgi:hypothetical protein
VAGLTFQATSGLISSPFTSTTGVLSQPSETDLTGAGRASYTFSVSDADNYVVEAVVDAPDTASNSFYVNIDSEPTDPAMIWDIPATSGFEQRTVSWRGGGTFENNELVPKVFNLSAGSHQLLVRGRESNVRLDRISIAKAQAPSPPLGLSAASP